MRQCEVPGEFAIAEHLNATDKAFLRRPGAMILLYGASRLWRQALKNILAAEFNGSAIHEIAEPDPAAFGMLTFADWLIAFPAVSGDREKIQELAQHTFHTNVLLLSLDGSAVVRLTDHAELQHPDISLDELERILRTPMERTG